MALNYVLMSNITRSQIDLELYCTMIKFGSSFDLICDTSLYAMNRKLRIYVFHLLRDENLDPKYFLFRLEIKCA